MSGDRPSRRTWIGAGLVLAAVAGLTAMALWPRASAPTTPGASRVTASVLPGGIRTPVYPSVAGPRFAGANIVVISIDTLRRDHLAPYGAGFETPAASQLAREGVVFEHAVAQVPLTLPSHVSLFTGLYPPRHGVRDNGGFVLEPHATTLAERLLAAGYRTAGFVSSYVLHSRWGIGQGYETYDDLFDFAGLERRALTDVERPGGQVVDAAIAWLRQGRSRNPAPSEGSPGARQEISPDLKVRGSKESVLGSTESVRGSKESVLGSKESVPGPRWSPGPSGPGKPHQPFYLWVHLYDPHDPYDPPDAFRRRAPTPYAGEVMYADAQAHRLLAALESLGLRQRTLIVFLSDHGESLGEHGEPTHGIFLYGASLDVPLIIAPPQDGDIGSPPLALAGRRVSGLARLVDVVPTVLDLLGLPPAAGLDGISLLPMLAHDGTAHNDTPVAGEPDALAGPVAYAETYYPRFHYNWNELAAVQTGRWKFVEAPRAELYDRLTDPKELRDVSTTYPRVAATLARQLESMRPPRSAGEPAPAALDADARARLQSLGYVSGSETTAPRAPGPRRDPKDGLPLLRQLLQAQADRDAGHLDAALARLEELTHADPTNPAVFVALSSVHDRRGDRDRALTASQHAVALDPENVVAVLDLALAYRNAGRPADAAVGFERVLSLDPDNIKALLSLAEIHRERGETAKAFELAQRAVAVAPRSADARIGLGAAALELDRLDVAEGALTQALALGADAPDLHFNLGVMAEQQGRRAVAVREYRAEVARYPASLKAWVNLGLLERQAGKAAEALAAFERAAAAASDAVEGPYLLAETLFALERRDEARRWAAEAVRRSPTNPRAQALLRTIGQ